MATEIDTVQSSVSWALGANLENLTLTGSAAINGTGNALNNSLIGNRAANILTGGLGNDTLDGGAGNDTLIGGTGNDTYVVDSTGDRIYETSTLAAETDTVCSSISWTLGANLENLVLTGTNRLNGSGNAEDNYLTGNDSDNVLNGGGGNDTLDGGLGNDTLIGGAGSDTASYAWATDAVTVDLFWASSQNTGAGGWDALDVENVTGGSGSDSLTGDGAANVLTGGAGNDTLDGGLGNDTLYGGDGRDCLLGGGGNDILCGGSGVEDTLTGGAGSDTFTFGSEEANEMYAAVIMDFNASEGDRIDLSAIDANTTQVGDQAFTFGTRFNYHAGDLIYIGSYDYTAGCAMGYLAGDTNGDGHADVIIKLPHEPSLTASSITL